MAVWLRELAEALVVLFNASFAIGYFGASEYDGDVFDDVLEGLPVLLLTASADAFGDSRPDEAACRTDSNSPMT